MRATVAYLSSEDAALYLGYRHEDGTPNLEAFAALRHRRKVAGQPIKALKLGRRLRFRVTDLERVLEAV